VRAIAVAPGKIPSELFLSKSASFSVLYCLLYFIGLYVTNYSNLLRTANLLF